MLNTQSTDNLNDIRNKLKIVKASIFKDFDGRKVAQDLKKHHDLWLTVNVYDANMKLIETVERAKTGSPRSIRVMSSDKGNEKLELLARSWNPDSVVWSPLKEVATKLGYYVMSVWWD